MPISQKERIRNRLNELVKHPSFNDDMFTWLVKDIISDCKKSIKDDEAFQNETKNFLKELIYARTRTKS